MSTLFAEEDDLSPYMMPEKYKGKVTKGGGFTTFQPRQWTEKEMEWAQMLKEKGLSNKSIATCLGREPMQVSIKMKRLGKKDKTYNTEHRAQKYEANDKFLELIKPKSVLDVYAGEPSYYEGKFVGRLVTNDKNAEFDTNRNLDALDCCCLHYAHKDKFDIVDLDPFGSAYDCFDLAIKMAKKGLVITLGELGHKRFKRLDFVRRYYGIESLEDFNTDKLIQHIVKIGERNKKKLTPSIVMDWGSIARVYFTISELKITEQWKVK